jgi:hypothetical protein
MQAGEAPQLLVAQAVYVLKRSFYRLDVRLTARWGSGLHKTRGLWWTAPAFPEVPCIAVAEDPEYNAGSRARCRTSPRAETRSGWKVAGYTIEAGAGTEKDFRCESRY